MKPVETIKSARKKWSAVRGPIMLVVITVLLGIMGLKITETMGVKDANEWIADYIGLLYGLLLVIMVAAFGAFVLVMVRKLFRGGREPHAWEVISKKESEKEKEDQNK
jgi:cytochrome bd-type quinol oxidase subunit 2